MTILDKIFKDLVETLSSKVEELENESGTLICIKISNEGKLEIVGNNENYLDLVTSIIAVIEMAKNQYEVTSSEIVDDVLSSLEILTENNQVIRSSSKGIVTSHFVKDSEFKGDNKIRQSFINKLSEKGMIYFSSMEGEEIIHNIKIDDVSDFVLFFNEKEYSEIKITSKEDGFCFKIGEYLQDSL